MPSMTTSYYSKHAQSGQKTTNLYTCIDVSGLNTCGSDNWVVRTKFDICFITITGSMHLLVDYNWVYASAGGL